MTREEQIYSQSISYTKNIFGEIEDFSDVVDAFADGVRWADENPQFSKEEFIKKAREWLKENVSKYSYVIKVEDTEYKKVHFTDSLIEDFRKAMEE